MRSNIVFEQRLVSFIKNWIRERAFISITRDALPLFVRGRDRLSIHPQIAGTYEPHIRSLIERYAACGYSDFLIDIGANIGLTSCLSGDRFRRVVMFEPNPDCCGILRVNARIALRKCEYRVCEYGLAGEAGTMALNVPMHNWGGAFIQGSGNSYSERRLATKDGFATFDPRNYEQVTIRVESSTDVLAKLFQQIRSDGFTSGVIKIDAEGYEPTILNAIADTLPSSMKLMVIFESWNPNFALGELIARFGGRATALRLEQIPAARYSRPRVLRLFSLLASNGYSFRLSQPRAGEAHGDIVLEIEALQ